MRYKLRRRLYSQNFLCNPKLTLKLIRLSSIGKKDAVIEIGPGKGFITEQLLNHSGKVVAIELDRRLCLYLKSKFSEAKSLEIINRNFLNYQLPNYPFKIFSNIPFNLTTDIIRKLTSNPNFSEGYIIIQKEAAKRFVGKPYDAKNSMQAMLLKPWFKIDVIWNFKRWDFVPKPNVDVVMIKITRRQAPLVLQSDWQVYKDYVVYTYNNQKVAKLPFEIFLEKFGVYIKHTDDWERKLISQKAGKILSLQKKIEKIHRTRNDKSWRKFNK